MDARNKCVRDVWCRCPECRKKGNYGSAPLAGLKNRDPNYGVRATRDSSSSPADHAEWELTPWQQERRKDYRCFDCGWMRARDLAAGRPSEFAIVAGVRQGRCPKCRAARIESIRSHLERWGVMVLGLDEEAFVRPGKGPKPPEITAQRSYALALLEEAGATRKELAEATGLSESTISRDLTRNLSVSRPIVKTMSKVYQALGGLEVGARREPADMRSAQGSLRPGRAPYWAYHGQRELKVKMETQLDRIERYTRETREDMRETRAAVAQLVRLVGDGADPDGPEIAQAVEALIADALGEAA